jgi:hypothetical protein
MVREDRVVDAVAAAAELGYTEAPFPSAVCIATSTTTTRVK